MNYASHMKATQTEKAKPEQVLNSAGGYTFKIDKWARLDRFLILGTEGGTYYAGERELTRDNAACISDCISDCLAENGPRTVARIVEISDSGRAPKNDPAIFALALASASSDIETRKAVYDALPKVCRIGTHLFHFVSAVNELRGWSKGLQKAIKRWYLGKPLDGLAHEVLKYQQRDGMSHRDVLRLAHPKLPPSYSGIARYVVAGADGLGVRSVNDRGDYPAAVLHPKLFAYEALKKAEAVRDVVKLIEAHNFSHEMIPTKWKNEVSVWAALLPKMPITATIRNLGKMTSIGLLKPLSPELAIVRDRIANLDLLKKGRVHPIQALSALVIYDRGHGERGALSWTPIRQVTEALNAAFNLSFQTVEPTGKTTVLALDVSGSMCSGEIAGVPGLTPRAASAAMAMVTARSEKDYVVVGFTGSGVYGGGTALTVIEITPNMSIQDVIRRIDALHYGTTDCSLPMQWAQQNRIGADSFAIYTDNETYAGRVHPHVALKDYRKASGRASKLAVVGMTATEFSIADPGDSGMMDFVGFDSSAPALMADFFRKEI